MFYRTGWALIFLAAGLALVTLAWTNLTPLGPVGKTIGPSQANLDPVQVRSILTRTDPFVARGGENDAAAPEGFSLFGTRADLSGRGGSAIIGLPDGTQGAFSVGDEVQPGVTLAAVAPDHVILDQQGQRQTLTFTESLSVLTPSDPQPGPVSGGQPVAPAASASPVADDGLVHLLEATSDGNQSVLTIRTDAPSALLAPLGLKPGDKLLRLNGQAPDASAARLFRSGATVPVTIKRGEQTLDLTLRIP
ncbi:MAG: type II secretion system protein N [Asticcacaulis sp.]